MAEIVNLRAARKLRDRSKKRAQGDENTMKFGRTRIEREADQAREAKARAFLDGHRREPEDEA